MLFLSLKLLDFGKQTGMLGLNFYPEHVFSMFDPNVFFQACFEYPVQLLNVFFATDKFWMTAQHAPKNNHSVCFCNFALLSCGAHGAHAISGPRALLSQLMSYRTPSWRGEYSWGMRGV